MIVRRGEEGVTALCMWGLFVLAGSEKFWNFHVIVFYLCKYNKRSGFVEFKAVSVKLNMSEIFFSIKTWILKCRELVILPNTGTD